MMKSCDKQDRWKSLHDKETRGANATYRRAILKALESLHDYQSRSNIDAIRRITQDFLEAQTWNDALFLQTLKSIVRKGEIDLFTKSTAEFSHEFKRKRTESLLLKLDEKLQASSPAMATSQEEAPPPSPKSPPHRRPEHEKWKILPKKIYDHTL